MIQKIKETSKRNLTPFKTIYSVIMYIDDNTIPTYSKRGNSGGW